MKPGQVIESGDIDDDDAFDFEMEEFPFIFRDFKPAGGRDGVS